MSLLWSLQPQPRQHTQKKKPHPLIILGKNMPEKLKILFVWPNCSLVVYREAMERLSSYAESLTQGQRRHVKSGGAKNGNI